MEAINYTKLHDIVKKSGLSMMKIAYALGLSREGLYKKLNGENDFKVTEFRNLCEVLGVKEETLFTERKVTEIHYPANEIQIKDNYLSEKLNEISKKVVNSDKEIFLMANEIFMEVCKGMPVEMLFNELNKSIIDENSKEVLRIRLAEYLEWRESKNDRRGR